MSFMDATRQAIANQARLMAEDREMRAAKAREAEQRERAKRAAVQTGRRDPLAEWNEEAKQNEIPFWGRKFAWRPWLSRQASRTDAIGSLARHAVADDDFPRSPFALIPHLAAHLAQPVVLETARRALAEWRAWLEADVAREIREIADRNGAAESVRARSLEVLRELLAEEIGA